MWRASLTGVWAALAAPWWLSGRRFAGLLVLSAEPKHTRTQTSAADAQMAIRVSHAIIRLLARIPASPWRNTCLFRSVTECLVLRHFGLPARVSLGVRKASPALGAVDAHAWVETTQALDAGYTPLQPSISSQAHAPASR
ncbi:MAG TPA: lasso peptide biosynthesis B2 protein [Gemmatimonadaceae bacterium]|jgi:hypothetical protein|nr:lasso peptide biosynthesis B2 protein [Gemmatimonadaceae bacterium]